MNGKPQTPDLTITLGTVLIEILIIQCLIFMAFASTVHSMINRTGGRSALGKLSIMGKFRLMKQVIKKVLFIQLIILLLVLVFAVLTEIVGITLLDKHVFLHSAAQTLLAFTGMVYSDGLFISRVAAACMSIAVFFWVIAVATGKPVSWSFLFQSLRQHWFAMLVSALVLTACLHFINENQRRFLFVHLLDWSGDRYRSLVYILYQTAFALLRMWFTIFVLTMALKWSYRRS